MKPSFLFDLCANETAILSDSCLNCGLKKELVILILHREFVSFHRNTVCHSSCIYVSRDDLIAMSHQSWYESWHDHGWDVDVIMSLLKYGRVANCMESLWNTFYQCPHKFYSLPLAKQKSEIIIFKLMVKTNQFSVSFNSNSNSNRFREQGRFFRAYWGGGC